MSDPIKVDFQTPDGAWVHTEVGSWAEIREWARTMPHGTIVLVEGGLFVERGRHTVVRSRGLRHGFVIVDAWMGDWHWCIGEKDVAWMPSDDAL